MGTKNSNTTPQACPLNDNLILELLRGNLLTVQGICDRHHDELSIEPEDFTIQVDGEPDGFFADGLPHVLVESQGEQFELIRPSDFDAFVESGFMAGGAR